MVETVEPKKKDRSREALLARRVERLARELDRLEDEHKRHCELFRKAVATLSGMLDDEVPGLTARAVLGLKKTIAKVPPDPQKLEQAVEELRKTLLVADTPGRAPVRKPEEEEDARTRQAFVSAVGLLTAMAPPDPNNQVNQAAVRLKQALVTRPWLVPELLEASQELKAALFNEEADQEPQPAGEASSEIEVLGPPSDPREKVGWRMAMALLRGMHLGDEDFDAGLGRVENAIEQVQKTGEVDRPTLAMAADLVAQFRGVLEARQKETVSAFSEIMREVMDTQSSLTQTMSQAGEKLLAQGRSLQDQVDQSVQGMTQQIGAATDLEELKSTALDQVRGLRDQVRSRLETQRQVLEENRDKTQLLTRAVRGALERMQKAEEKAERMERESYTDPLSGALNRRAFDRILAANLAQSGREPVFLLALEVDDFDSLRQGWGEAAADKALATLRVHLTDCLGEKDYLFRMRDELFAVLIIGGMPDHAAQTAEKLRTRVENILFSYGKKTPMRLTASVVVAQAENGEQAVPLWERVHRALVSAQTYKHNQVVELPPHS